MIADKYDAIMKLSDLVKFLEALLITTLPKLHSMHYKSASNSTILLTFTIIASKQGNTNLTNRRENRGNTIKRENTLPEEERWSR